MSTSRIVGRDLRATLTGPVEERDTDNIPVDCPIDRQAMKAYLARLEASDLLEGPFNPCIDCEFFRVIRLDAQANAPVRDHGDWFDYGLCMSPDRPEPALVTRRRVQGRARKVVPDDATVTNDRVLDCIDDGLRTVRDIVAETGLAERSVFKVIARLRLAGVLERDNPLRRTNSSVATITPRSESDADAA